MVSIASFVMISTASFVMISTASFVMISTASFVMISTISSRLCRFLLCENLSFILIIPYTIPRLFNLLRKCL